MHIYFSGIGGTGIGPLSMIAHQAGYWVSGSDKQDSQYIKYLTKHGIENIHIGQTEYEIDKVHQANHIDWLVYSSAVEKEDPNHPELVYAKEHGIKISKRDEFLSEFIGERDLKLIAIAGTHGKSTTTAMMIWTMKQLNIPISYSVGAKLSFGDMGHFDESSRYFVYECDEYDRNFLKFNPFLSIITGVAWDHHEIYPTFEDYKEAFKKFTGQSDSVIGWQEDIGSLQNRDLVSFSKDSVPKGVKLSGDVNRQNAWQVIKAVNLLTNTDIDRLIEILNAFPGLSRRMEQLKPGLYTDYAHTPEKISGAIQTARELVENNEQKLVVIYEPLTNRRANYIKDLHSECLRGADKIYWVPTYLAREDKNQKVLSPQELINRLDPEVKHKAEPCMLNEELKIKINEHLNNSDLVLALSGGGGNSLDEWLRVNF